MEVSASILSVNEEESIHTFYRLETAHIDYFHIDVMDGKFVENNTSEKMKQYTDNIKNISNIPLDVHIMVENIKEYVDVYAPCMPTKISFHIEASKDKETTMKMINYIKEDGIKVGIAVNPETDIKEVFDYLPYIHTVLIMSVHPGKGGQEFIPETIDKINKLKKYLKENDLDTEIEVDGGVNLENVKELKECGVDIAVVGTALINAKDYKYTVDQIRA